MMNHPILDYLMTALLALVMWLMMMWVLAGCVKVVRDAQPGSCAKSDTHLLLYCREQPTQPSEKEATP